MTNTKLLHAKHLIC